MDHIILTHTGLQQVYRFEIPPNLQNFPGSMLKECLSAKKMFLCIVHRYSFRANVMTFLWQKFH